MKKGCLFSPARLQDDDIHFPNTVLIGKRSKIGESLAFPVGLYDLCAWIQ